jgi:glyoxylase-like metal-dependent hydrolase (beta-lactamase superfamily II)
MTGEITTLRLPLPLGMGRVNCYLIPAEGGYILIDSGGHNGRRPLVQHLQRAGCVPGGLRLIILTHGDFDHTGNAAYLHTRYGAPIAMHPDDAGMIAHRDMFHNRTAPNALIPIGGSILFRFDRADRFEPDLVAEEGYDLSRFGFDARVLSIPGHSKGSIGILTGDGDLFCGDLLVNSLKPSLNRLIDDLPTARASVARLKSLGTGTVYPGHGRPFAMAELGENI